MQSEDTLIRARQLDTSTLTQIHDRFFPEIYRYVRFRLDDEQVCEDIVSEVFLRLLDALHKQRGPQENLRGWLFGTASNLVNDHLRFRYSHHVEPLDDHAGLSDDRHPENTFEQIWQQEQVRNAVRQLTPEQQHVLALRFAEDRSLDEAANIMGKTVTAIKALQFRAIGALRRAMKHKVRG